MWHGFDQKNNMFATSLARRFNIEICNKPEFLIHSIYGKKYLKYDCCRICFTGDNTRPDFKHNDYNIGFDLIDDNRYLRWPIFLAYGVKPSVLTNSKDPEILFPQKDRFCTFVVSNKYALDRINFFNSLNAYKKVDSGGGYLNNVGGPVAHKRAFLKAGKFTIAFENSSYPGYTTEKIFEAFLSNTVPIYWGNPKIAEDFNPRSFINVHDFQSFKEVIEYVMFLDQDDKAYKQILGAPPFIDNMLPAKFNDEIYYTFFKDIFSSSSTKKSLVAAMTERMEYARYVVSKTRRNIQALFSNRKMSS